MNLKHYIRYPLEAVAVALFHYGFRAMGLDASSNFSGWLISNLGPKYKKLNRLAESNLRIAFPEKTQKEIDEIIKGMWDNLGRVVAEYSHLDHIDESRIKIVNGHIVDMLRDDGKPGFFMSAHYTNWEIAAMSIIRRGIPLTQVYRAANNPMVNAMVRNAQYHVKQDLIQKSNSGAKQLLAAMNSGKHIMMMIDQRMDNGISVPFFGKDAMTAPALAKLALRYKCPIVPVQVVRTHGSNFEVRFSDPLELPEDGTEEQKVLSVMKNANSIIESWIRERPDLWLWIHRRWPS